MKKLNIREWDKFNNLTILKELCSDKNWRRFEYKCICWKIWIISSNNLKKAISCWCVHNKWTHKMSRTRIYRIYFWIQHRIYNQNWPAYKDYGWRWIKCEWNSFEEFYEDMWKTYKEWLSIERVDVNWNYCKENCEWISFSEQVKNRRISKKYNWKLIRDICREEWISIDLVMNRINNLWWDIKKSLEEKPKKPKLYNGKAISEWAKIYWIPRQTLNSRINIRWLTLEQALNFKK